MTSSACLLRSPESPDVDFETPRLADFGLHRICSEESSDTSIRFRCKADLQFGVAVSYVDANQVFWDRENWKPYNLEWVENYVDGSIELTLDLEFTRPSPGDRWSLQAFETDVASSYHIVFDCYWGEIECINSY